VEYDLLVLENCDWESVDLNFSPFYSEFVQQFAGPNLLLLVMVR